LSLLLLLQISLHAAVLSGFPFALPLHFSYLVWSESNILVDLKEQVQSVKLTTHLHPSTEVKNSWSYTSTPPMRHHGVVLRWSTGKTIHLPFSKLVLYTMSVVIIIKHVWNRSVLLPPLLLPRRVAWSTFCVSECDCGVFLTENLVLNSYFRRCGRG